MARVGESILSIGEADGIGAERQHARMALGDRPVLLEQIDHAISLSRLALRPPSTRSSSVRVSESTLSGMSMSKWSSTSMTKSITDTELILRSAEMSVLGCKRDAGRVERLEQLAQHLDRSTDCRWS